MFTLSNNNTLNFATNQSAHTSAWRATANRSRFGASTPKPSAPGENAQSHLVSRRRETLESLNEDFPLNALIRFIQMKRTERL